MKESLFKISTFLHILVGIVAFIGLITSSDPTFPGGKYFDIEVAVFASMPGILTILLGMGILKKQTSIIIIDLIMLPVIWFFVGFGPAFGHALGGGNLPWWAYITFYGPMILWPFTVIALFIRISESRKKIS